MPFLTNACHFTLSLARWIQFTLFVYDPCDINLTQTNSTYTRLVYDSLRYFPDPDESHSHWIWFAVIHCAIFLTQIFPICTRLVDDLLLFLLLLLLWRNSPKVASASPFLRFLDPTQCTTHSVGLLCTIDRPEAETSDNTQHSNETKKYYAPAGFGPTIPESDRPLILALDRWATEISSLWSIVIFSWSRRIQFTLDLSVMHCNTIPSHVIRFSFHFSKIQYDVSHMNPIHAISVRCTVLSTSLRRIRFSTACASGPVLYCAAIHASLVLYGHGSPCPMHFPSYPTISALLDHTSYYWSPYTAVSFSSSLVCLSLFFSVSCSLLFFLLLKVSISAPSG